MIDSRLRRVLVLAGLIGVVTGCAAPTQRFEYAEIIMGVEARITLYAWDEPSARVAARGAFDRLAGLDAVMSDYRHDSELMRLCRTSGEDVPISDDLLRVLDRSQVIADASDGAFDVTVGPLVDLWRTARRDGALPAEADLRAARMRTGRRRLAVDPAAGTARLAVPGMRLDLGGIGKGFAAEEARAFLARRGVERCLVDLGGDVAVGAPPPDRAAWRVAIAAPSDDSPRRLDLARIAVATSGDTEQYVVVDGVRYSHIVDPRTGIGLTNRMAVTVLAPDGATADALASAVSVLGPVDGVALVEAWPDAEVLVHQRVGDAWVRRSSPGFPLR
jgi:thiamine biosynthesis lipoprotein